MSSGWRSRLLSDLPKPPQGDGLPSAGLRRGTEPAAADRGAAGAAVCCAAAAWPAVTAAARPAGATTNKDTTATLPGAG